MEFHEKLQALRKQQGLTQEELAEALYVSRTAVSKWESGRGYPNIDSLKAISNFFSVTIDELLSGEEVLALAEDDHKQKQAHLRDLVFGALDLSTGIFFFAPFFRQTVGGQIQATSLSGISQLQPWLVGAYFAVILATVLAGILILALQNFQGAGWNKYKISISSILNVLGVLLFIFSHQPYAAGLTFVFLAIKALILIRRP